MAAEDGPPRKVARVGEAGLGAWAREVVDSHIHLCHAYSGGLPNEWVSTNTPAFQRDWTEEDYKAAVSRSRFRVGAAVFVQCFNGSEGFGGSGLEEAKWVLGMVEDPSSLVVGLTAGIHAQKGAEEVERCLTELRREDGSLPRGLKGARTVFMLPEYSAPDACLEERFLDGLRALQRAGLLWEFCCRPAAAHNVAKCCAQLPKMTFVVDHLAHNGNDGGGLEEWAPAIDALGALPNVFVKMGAIEEWDVPDPEPYLDRAIAAIGFDRIIFESNWFVSEAMGDTYARTAELLLAACLRAGATDEELRKVFASNARKAYGLDGK